MKYNQVCIFLLAARKNNYAIDANQELVAIGRVMQ